MEAPQRHSHHRHRRHDHAHHHGHGNIRFAFFLNLGFTLFELVGGLWTNSMAILSDAVHDLGDSLTLGLAWYLEHRSKKAGNEKYSFGYQRFSLLAALITGLVLLTGSMVVLAQAIPRLIQPTAPHATGMVWIALVGIVVNGVAMWRLRLGHTLNERMVSWHMLEDVLGWVAVLVVGIVLHFVDWYFLDAAVSIVIVLYVSYGALKHLRTTVSIFLQGVPPGISPAQLASEISGMDQVLSVHHTHLWSLDGQHHVLTMHIRATGIKEINEIIDLKNKAKAIIKSYGIEHATVEIELEGEACFMGK